MNTSKYLAIGSSDFKSIIEDDCYYFDKTKFIEEIVKDKTKVKLFTRPRRFGKTLNITTLKYFFDVKNKEENRQLFKDLYIERSTVFEKQGQHPVIFISFKDIKQNTWADSEKRIKFSLSSLYKEYKHIYTTLDDADQNEFGNIWYKRDNGDYTVALNMLCKYVAEFYGKKIVLLIDEYDTPIISAHQYGYYDEAINFFKTLLSTALKDNPYLETAVLTGIVRVANENIFSGLNNIKVYTILDEKYEDSFGLTESEVVKALEHFEMKESIHEIKEWYNGYKFGNFDIYNPWSIINYLDDKKVGVYWINTSGNYLIKQALRVAESDVFNEFNLLLKGKSIEKNINKETSFIDIGGKLVSWHLLLFSGYLTVDERIGINYYSIKLTNKEVQSYFAEQFIKVNFGDDFNYSKMFYAFKEERFAEFEELLGELIMKTMSPIDTRKKEEIYHMYILGLISNMVGEYFITSNEFTGKGRSDITLEPRSGKGTGFILEFKVAKDEKEFESLPKKALKQIKDNKYYTNLQDRRIQKIVAVALVFYGKEVKVEFDQYMLK